LTRRTFAAPLLLAIAVAAFVALNLTIGLHPDDASIMADSEHRSYGELWTSPFLDRFYRPIVVTIVRASTDLFGAVALPLRILQGALIVACVHTTVTMFRERVVDAARYAGGLVLLASPLTFVAVTQFAVGVGDLVVGWMFLLSVRACLTTGALDTKTAAALAGYSALALFSKESGLLVAAYCAYETGRRKHGLVFAIICSTALGYLYFRTTFVTRTSFEFSTGYFFEAYSPTELDEKFGASPGFYAYNVAANLSNALIGFPEKGQLRLSLHAALLIPAAALTTALVARYLTIQRRWKMLAPFVAIVVMNAALGYTYVRSRIMFVGAFSLSILVIYTIDDLRNRSQRVLGVDGRTAAAVFLGVWTCVLVHSLVRLPIQAVAP
jgi:hypothetical protein